MSSVRALAEETLQLAEKSTVGPWEWDNGVLLHVETDVAVVAHDANAKWDVDQDDQNFIAAVRTSAPVVARAYLDALKALDECRLTFEALAKTKAFEDSRLEEWDAPTMVRAVLIASGAAVGEETGRE